MAQTDLILKLNIGLAKQFIKLRESQGMTVGRMAKILGYNPTTLRNKERNKAPINTHDLTTYATYFKLFPSDLVSMAEQEIIETKKEDQCIT